MNMELLKTFKLLEESQQTDEVIQIKNQIKESLQHELKSHFNELFAIGQVIGYDEVQKEFTEAIRALEVQKQKVV